MCVEGRGKLSGAGSVLSPVDSLGLNSGHQSRQQVPPLLTSLINPFIDPVPSLFIVITSTKLLNCGLLFCVGPLIFHNCPFPTFYCLLYALFEMMINNILVKLITLNQYFINHQKVSLLLRSGIGTAVLSEKENLNIKRLIFTYVYVLVCMSNVCRCLLKPEEGNGSLPKS